MNNKMLDQKETDLSKEGRIGIYFLKAIWTSYQQLKINPAKAQKVEWKYVNAVFNALGIGTEPSIKYLMGFNPSFDQFEDWIITNGSISQPMISQFNALVSGKNDDDLRLDDTVFSDSELEQWENDGYIILKNAIPKADCEASVNLIYDTIDARPSHPETWYKPHPLKQGIMVQLFNAPILEKNRHAKRIQMAYRQLWKRNDLLVSMDRVSFNPPETKTYQFPGPNLHWDVSLKQPIPFGLQGLLYLSDTDEHQGAFTVILGFQNHIHDWLNQLAPDENPRDSNLLADFKATPIAANAGDLIIWHHCLPHGSSPNTSKTPRIVQYINYQPLHMETQKEWI